MLPFTPRTSPPQPVPLSRSPLITSREQGGRAAGSMAGTVTLGSHRGAPASPMAPAWHRAEVSPAEGRPPATSRAALLLFNASNPTWSEEIYAVCKSDCPQFWGICEAPALGGSQSLPWVPCGDENIPSLCPVGHSPPSSHSACLPHGSLASGTPRGIPKLATHGSPMPFASGCVLPSLGLASPKAGWPDGCMPSSKEPRWQNCSLPGAIAAWLGCAPQHQRGEAGRVGRAGRQAALARERGSL